MQIHTGQKIFNLLNDIEEDNSVLNNISKFPTTDPKVDQKLIGLARFRSENVLRKIKALPSREIEVKDSKYKQRKGCYKF